MTLDLTESLTELGMARVELDALRAEIERLRTALKTIMGEEGVGMMWSERCEIVRRALEGKP